MRQREEASYFAARAQEEIQKACEARARGDEDIAVAVHAELAVRYQAKALQLRRS